MAEQTVTTIPATNNPHPAPQALACRPEKTLSPERGKLLALIEEADMACSSFHRWADHFLKEVGQVTGPLYKEVAVNRILGGNVNAHGSTMISPDRIISMLHAHKYAALDKLKEGSQEIRDYLYLAEYFARVLEKLEEKEVRS